MHHIANARSPAALDRSRAGGEDTTFLLLYSYSLFATGQVTLRRLDAHEENRRVIGGRVTAAA
jgi:hypothetical protein